MAPLSMTRWSLLARRLNWTSVAIWRWWARPVPGHRIGLLIGHGAAAHPTCIAKCASRWNGFWRRAYGRRISIRTSTRTCCRRCSTPWRGSHRNSASSGFAGPLIFLLEASGIPLTRRVVSRMTGVLRRRFYRVLRKHGCRTTDHFAGFRITGLYDTAELATLIRNLPDGTTELMTHPGLCTDELRSAHTRLKESREAECTRSPRRRSGPR